jgi:hypothetical protein
MRLYNHIRYGTCGISVPETIGSRPGHDKRDGRSGIRQPFVAMVFSLLSRREGEAYEEVESCDGRRGNYLGRGRAWIESGPSTT